VADQPACLVIAASAASVGRARELADELPRARVSRTVAEAERHIERASVDLAIVVADRLDVQSTAVTRLGRLPHRLPVLVEADAGDTATLFALLRAGADGLVAPDSGVDVVLRCAAAVRSGEVVLPRAAVRHLVTEVRLAKLRADPRGALNPLTEREREVAVLQYAGMETREVAERLVISETTVRSHLHSALKRLRLRSRDDLYRLLDGS
jgi:DNA-binding NarL/FixJ family response regulator